MISVIQLGSIDYATALQLQQKLVALRKEEQIGDVLLLLEHKPVITLGRNAKAANIVASPEFLKQRDVELFECDRGGDVTFHGPGQIVGYPIFDLRGFSHSSPLSSRAEENDSQNRSLESKDLAFPARKHIGVIDFVRRLEDVLMRTCADFEIPTKRVAGLTGVWTDPQPLSSRAEENDSKNRSLESRDLGFADAAPEGVLADPFVRPVERSSTATADSARQPEDKPNREGHDFSRAVNDPERTAASAAEAHESKLAAIGVHISRSVTSHGFALNVNTDLSYFNLIIPCGITTKPVTSMQKELGLELNLNAVAESISRNFGTVFQSQILWLDTLDALVGDCMWGQPPSAVRLA